MAMGSSAHTTVEAVKSTCNSLEVSPSHRSKTSPIAHGGTRAVAHGAHAERTTKLQHGSTRGKPRGTKTHIGKKNMMAQKSHGR